MVDEAPTPMLDRDVQERLGDAFRDRIENECCIRLPPQLESLMAALSRGESAGIRSDDDR